MKKIYCPHDRLFKSSMTDLIFAKNFLQRHLPEKIKSLIDFNSLSLSKNSYVSNNLEERNSDILFKVNFMGKMAYIYLLCEHQSTMDPLMSFRLWYYIMCIWFDHLKQTKDTTLPLIIPIVFYHGEEPYTAPMDIKDLIQGPKDIIENFLFKSYYLIDTHEISDETLRQQEWDGLMCVVMKHIYARDFMTYANEIAEMLNKLSKNDHLRPLNFIGDLLKYILDRANLTEPDKFMELMQEKVSTNSTYRGEIMSAAGWFIEKGRILLLKELLQIKFGFISEYYLRIIENAGEDQLSAFSKKIFTAKNLEELFSKECVLTR